MRVVQATAFGAPSVLTVTDLPDPVPGPGQVSIDVSHAAVGLVDLTIRQGVYADQPGMPQPPFTPGLEVAGTVRALGANVDNLRVGEQVVAMSQTGAGGYASVYVAEASRVVSIEGHGIDHAIAVSVIPNAAMAFAALTEVAHLREGESVLVHGALGGLASAFPGMAKQLGASRVVGTVLADKLDTAAESRLPYDQVVDSADIAALGEGTFDIVIDPVGGALRTQSLSLLAPGGRLVAAGNASGDWDHAIVSSQLWLSSITVSGFNAGAFLPTHPHVIRPALEAARAMVAAGLGEIDVETLGFDQAALAHDRMESRAVSGRLVLVPQA